MRPWRVARRRRGPCAGADAWWDRWSGGRRTDRRGTGRSGPAVPVQGSPNKWTGRVGPADPMGCRARRSPRSRRDPGWSPMCRGEAGGELRGAGPGTVVRRKDGRRRGRGGGAPEGPGGVKRAAVSRERGPRGSAGRLTRRWWRLPFRSSWKGSWQSRRGCARRFTT
ncbi:hypothetical protein SSCG_04255 [Streptomyces clavuligerus]|nr:hypothetical protein SSCG_04255 [Streptomyces clavuligerus]